MDYGWDDDDYSYNRSLFKKTYRCYPFSAINRPHLEESDKILMPVSALHDLATLHIEYPMLFEICNPSALRASHCGVLEFTAEEGLIYLPFWMMQNLLLQEGDIVQIKTASLPKGTFVKLQPHTKEFLDISNPKAILEKSLRSFSCLTTGDTIKIAYNNKDYYIDILETKPPSAISIIETDCEVDFAAPLDYKEPENASPPTESDKFPAQEAKISPFTGLGRRLNEKPSEPAVAFASVKVEKTSTNAVGTTSSSRPSGKLVFGSKTSQGPSQIGSGNVSASQQQPKDEKSVSASQQQPKDEKSKFQAFTGRKYSLKD